MRTSSSQAAAHRSEVNEPSIDFDEDGSGEVTPRIGTHPEETASNHTSCSTDELVLQMLHLSRDVAPLRDPLNISRPRLIVLIHLKSVSMRSNPNRIQRVPTSFSKKKLVFKIKLALLKATEHEGSLAVSLNRVTMSTVDDRDPRLDLLARRLRKVSFAVELVSRCHCRNCHGVVDRGSRNHSGECDLARQSHPPPIATTLKTHIASPPPTSPNVPPPTSLHFRNSHGARTLGSRSL